MGYRFSWTGEEEQEEGEESIEEEYLETEGVSKPIIRIEFEDITENRRENGNPGNPTVVDLSLGEEAEGVEAQQRAVGEARDVKDGIDQRLIVERPEGNDYQQVEQGEGDMDNAADG